MLKGRIYNKTLRVDWLLFCLVFLLVLFSGCVRYKIKNIDSKGREIICFGDSITAGLGVSEEESYPRILSELLDSPVVNAGYSGDTSLDGIGRLERDVLSFRPRLVIIEFGGNDFLKKMPLSQTINNIRMMIERIQDSGAMVAIADISSGLIMRGYRKAYKRLAHQTRAIFIPSLLKDIISDPLLKVDHFHPNARGYRIIAERIYQVIYPYLK